MSNMTASDIEVLVGCLIALASAFVKPKPVIFGPLIFTWIGASAGICVASMAYYDFRSDRMHLEQSLPLMIMGMSCGLFVGLFIMELYLNSPKARARIEIGGVTLLFAGAAGASSYRYWNAEDGVFVSKLFQVAMIGGTVGFVAGLVQWRGSVRKTDLVGGHAASQCAVMPIDGNPNTTKT